MAVNPEVDPASALQFVINAAAGSGDADTKREVIQTALQVAGRRGELLFCRPAELAGVAHEAAARAIASRTAVVAVGGDGTLNTVAQAAHAVGCVMGAVPQGTFNYFARTHGIPANPAAAARQLLRSVPVPVQVAAVNDRVFLVNASLGLYPDLLEDREAYKARFGPQPVGGPRGGMRHLAARATPPASAHRTRRIGSRRAYADPFRGQQPTATRAVGGSAAGAPGKRPRARTR